jgi:hypothetical protein
MALRWRVRGAGRDSAGHGPGSAVLALGWGNPNQTKGERRRYNIVDPPAGLSEKAVVGGLASLTGYDERLRWSGECLSDADPHPGRR